MPIPQLQTPRLLLRPFYEDDAPVVQRLAGVLEVALTTQNIPCPYEDEMAEEWIFLHEQRWEAKEFLTLAITTEAEGVVGAVSLQLNLPNQRAELGYWVGLPCWNRRYATEASEAVVGFGFRELNLNRIQARHLVRNPASGQVMEKVGMEYEGVLRQYSLAQGQLEDIVMYALLASDR